MARVILDTDVASLTYKGRLPASLAAQLIGQEVCVTFVTVGELARWAEKRRWGTRARTELVAWLGRAVVLPYDERVAWKWGQLTVEAERRGRARPINDTCRVLRRRVQSRDACGAADCGGAPRRAPQAQRKRRGPPPANEHCPYAPGR